MGADPPVQRGVQLPADPSGPLPALENGAAPGPVGLRRQPVDLDRPGVPGRRRRLLVHRPGQHPLHHLRLLPFQRAVAAPGRHGAPGGAAALQPRPPALEKVPGLAVGGGAGGHGAAHERRPAGAGSGGEHPVGRAAPDPAAGGLRPDRGLPPRGGPGPGAPVAHGGGQGPVRRLHRADPRGAPHQPPVHVLGGLPPLSSRGRHVQQDPAGSGGHHPVYRRLHRRGGPRGPAGDVPRAVRGRRIPGAHLLPDDAPDHPAPGAQDRHPAHGQHPHFGLQGHFPGGDHRLVRPAQDHAVRSVGSPVDGVFGRGVYLRLPGLFRLLLRHVQLQPAPGAGAAHGAVGSGGAGSTEQGARSGEQGARSTERGARSTERGAGSLERGAWSREQGAGSRERNPDGARLAFVGLAHICPLGRAFRMAACAVFTTGPQVHRRSRRAQRSQ